MALIAKHFGGAASFEYLEKKTFHEIWFYYKLYEYQIVYDDVMREISYDSKGNPKTLPGSAKINAIVESRIKGGH